MVYGLEFKVYSLEFIAYDKEGNTKVDAADIGLDHLSGTDGAWHNELHGTALGVKSEQ
jgi:hypothetical protein